MSRTCTALTASAARRAARWRSRRNKMSMRGRILLVSVLGAASCAQIGAAWWFVSRDVPQPEVAYSTVVLDREGRLLRPYAISDGRWRLPANPQQVDPRYLRFLYAYEDKRFL